MPRNKTPGNDSLPIEFYIKFINLLGPMLIQCIKECFQSGELTNSQKQATITLIEKPGKDNRVLKSWRPISLINVDTKIISKIIASRICLVLPSIISQNQFAFVKDRKIDECLRLVADILYYTEKEKIPGIIFAADYAAAFDSLNHNFIISTFKLFGFPDYMITWIRILQTGMESLVLNNGYTTGYFPLSRGCRQGDPTSSYIFILVIEILSIIVQNNDNIKGINICGKQCKLALFADDSTFFLQDEDSLKTLQLIISDFAQFSSLELNIQKSEVAWIGSARDSGAITSEYKYIDLRNECIKILGINYTYSSELQMTNNFDKCQENFISSLRYWKFLNLSLYGRVTILKTLAIPKIKYICNVLIPSETFIRNIKSEIVNFLWKSSTSKIKYSTIISNRMDGGLDLPDIENLLKSCRIMWVKRLLDNKNCLWQEIPRYYLRKVGLWPVDINLDPLCYKSNKLPKFYNVCLQDWSSLFSQEPKDAVSVMAQPLWNNQFITKDGKSYWYKEFSDAGLFHISDIINPNGNFKHFNDLGLPVSQIYKWLILKHTIKKDWMTLLQNNVFQSRPRFPYLSLCGLRIELEWLTDFYIKLYLKESKKYSVEDV